MDLKWVFIVFSDITVTPTHLPANVLTVYHKILISTINDLQLLSYFYLRKEKEFGWMATGFIFPFYCSNFFF